MIEINRRDKLVVGRLRDTLPHASNALLIDCRRNISSPVGFSVYSPRSAVPKAAVSKSINWKLRTMPHASRILAGTLLSTALLAQPAHAQTPVENADGQTSGDPVETRSPNAPDQQPAFSEQTRAPQPGEVPEVDHDIFVTGLPQLWSFEFLPNGHLLAAAKAGDFYVISAEGEAGDPISGVPEVDARGQGGLLDVALAPDFESSNRIFFSFSEPREGGNGTSVASATLTLDATNSGSLENVEIIFRQMPTYDGQAHYGSRLVFGPEGELFVTTGERSDANVRGQAQDLNSGLGKVFRVDESGTALPDNPFVNQEEALAEIWSYGHRNIQSATLDGEGRLWTVEHGPRGGDELNRPEAGLNYGWPVVTYGIEYRGAPVGEGITESADTEQPVYYWDPVIGPSGMAFYEGDEFPEWQGAFLIGGLVSTGLVVLHMENDQVAYEERVPLDARVRDVKVGPDGAVYALTEDRNSGISQILRVTRAQ